MVSPASACAIRIFRMLFMRVSTVQGNGFVAPQVATSSRRFTLCG